MVSIDVLRELDSECVVFERSYCLCRGMLCLHLLCRFECGAARERMQRM